MSPIEELISSADRLCLTLDEAANNEKKFWDSVREDLERMSWEMLRMTNELKKLKEYQAGGF